MKAVKVYIILLLAAVAISCKAQPPKIKFSDPKIHYAGRIGYSTDAAELTWSASAVVFNFDGTAASAVLSDITGTDIITVIVDDKVTKILQPKRQADIYVLASGLIKGKHKIELFKRTEYDMGTLRFYGLNLEGRLLNPPTYKHTMEWYGDSITCGFAIEDTTGKDRGSWEFENGYKSYANLTARYFDADYRSESKSGIGFMVSWFNYIMPDIFDRVAANDSTRKWDFSKFTPEIVVVNLGQNDSWIVKNREQEQFKVHFGKTPPDAGYITKQYQGFIKSIRSKYPDAKIICALGNMDATKTGEPFPDYITQAVAGLHDNNIYTHFFTYKSTAGHPNAHEQQAMADDLILFIKQTCKW